MRVIVLTLVVLSGCGTYDLNHQRNAMDNSKVAYQSCLSSSGAAACETQRLVYEADVNSVSAIKRGKSNKE